MSTGNMCQAVSTSAVVRGRTNTSGRWAKSWVNRAKLCLRFARLSASLSSCTRPNAADSSDGLEVPADLVEDEEVVVFEVAVDRREEAPVDAFAGSVDLRLRPASPAAQQEAPVDEIVVVEAHHAAGSGRGDDVGQRERRDRDVRPGAGRRSAQRRPERVAGVLDDLQPMRVGDRADAIPVRARSR